LELCSPTERYRLLGPHIVEFSARFTNELFHSFRVELREVDAYKDLLFAPVISLLRNGATGHGVHGSVAGMMGNVLKPRNFHRHGNMFMGICLEYVWDMISGI